MNLLELFSGTKRVGAIAKMLRFNVILLGLKNADINTDILVGIIKLLTETIFNLSGLLLHAQNTAKQKLQELGILNMLTK